MKKGKKLAAIGIGMLMTSSLFAGCSTEGVALANAIGKSQTINSMQSKTDLTLKVSAANMSEQEKQTVEPMLPMINSSKISIAVKTIQNQDRTSSKVQEDFNMLIGGMPLDMSVWANADLKGSKTSFNEIIKMPKLLTAQLPNEFQNKDYMIMDSNMLSTPGMPEIDYNKLMTLSKELQSKLLYFTGQYAMQYNPGTRYITKIQENVYEVSITDRSLKDLMHYTLNNLAQNPEAVNFIRSYMSEVMSIYGTDNKEIQIALTQMNKSLIDLSTNLPQETANLNKSLDTLDNLKILGDDGIKVRYTINNEGYIVNESGSAQFIVDLPSIIKLSGAVASSDEPTGIYTINLGFNTDITNINGNVDIVFPKVDASNSFNYMELMKSVPALTK